MITLFSVSEEARTGRQKKGNERSLEEVGVGWAVWWMGSGVRRMEGGVDDTSVSTWSITAWGCRGRRPTIAGRSIRDGLEW